MADRGSSSIYKHPRETRGSFGVTAMRYEEVVVLQSPSGWTSAMS